MRKFEIIEVKAHNTYLLKDMDNGEMIELMLELYKIANPIVKDKILIANSLVDTRSPFYTQPYAFEFTKEMEPKQVKKMNGREYIVLNKNDENYTLKRIYG